MTKYYQRDSMMIGRKIANEFILVPIRQNVENLQYMYTLNNVGSRIWELLNNGGTTIEQIRDTLVSEYEVTPEQVEVDVTEFLNELRQIGAVTLVPVDHQ
jgi:hypothetical protein